MGCTVTRSKMAQCIVEGREEFSQNNYTAGEGDKERTNIANNVVEDMQEEPNKPATRTVADFSWLVSNTAHNKAVSRTKSLSSAD